MTYFWVEDIDYKAPLPRWREKSDATINVYN